LREKGGGEEIERERNVRRETMPEMRNKIVGLGPSAAVANPAVHTHFLACAGSWPQQATKSCVKKRLALHKQGRNIAFMRFLSLALANFRADVAA
jgi:hypothetical protein